MTDKKNKSREGDETERDPSKYSLDGKFSKTRKEQERLAKRRRKLPDSVDHVTLTPGSIPKRARPENEESESDE